MRLFFTTIAAVISLVWAAAQTTPAEVAAHPEMAGGVYFAYPVNDSTATPRIELAGYEPFYISHYNRHGSRYLISDEEYSHPLQTLATADSAGVLAPTGRRALDLLRSLAPEAHLRGGDLSPKGVTQLKGIGRRMASHYPEVFSPGAEVSARATTVMRVALSMDALCEALKEINPEVQITRESSRRYMDYLNYHSPQSNAYTSDSGPWRPEYVAFTDSLVKPARLMSAIFSDPGYTRRAGIDEIQLMWELYGIAVGQQNVETPGSIIDIFTPDELYNLWQVRNFDNYVRDSAYPGSNGLVLSNVNHLADNIIASADSVIATGGHGATLRFGHDGNLMPLAAYLGLRGRSAAPGTSDVNACDPSATSPEDAAAAFANFKVAPMAGNVQLIFFRPAVAMRGGVMVTALLNEMPVEMPVRAFREGPYTFHLWSDVKSYLQNRFPR